MSDQDERIGSTRVVGVGDGVRIIKIPEGYHVSERDPRSGVWGPWRPTTSEFDIAAYDEVMQPVTTPDDGIPTWLRPYEQTVADGEVAPTQIYVTTGPIDDIAHLAGYDDGFYKTGGRYPQTLPEWLEWRSKVAAALGLVERTVITERGAYTVIYGCIFEYGGDRVDIAVDVHNQLASREGHGPWVPVLRQGDVNAAIAAELRRLADTLEPGHPLVFPDGEIDGPASDVADWLRARAAELDPGT